MTLLRMCPGKSVEAISLPTAGQVPLDGGACVVIAGKACVLLAAADVTVNSCPALPAVVLAEHDEIRAGGQTYFLTAESAAAVEFVPRSAETCCARCKSALTPSAVYRSRGTFYFTQIRTSHILRRAG
jgi:hypothetical protein